MTRKTLTTSNGNPVDDDQNSMSASLRGPLLLEDFHLLDKLSHFNRERVPERVVHAKGAGAHGFFEVTKDVTHLCKAKFLDRVGKRTPVFSRFSTVGGESGSADTARDPRGFAVKFYTEEGNWDMVGNNTPVFFIRDPLKFPDFIHTQKRCPATHLKNPDMFWDFLSLVPESIHQTTILFSNRGTPDGFRHMNGYYGHTLKLVNNSGECSYVKWHFRTDQGIRNLKDCEAVKLAGSDPDYASRDLYTAIEKGQHPSWTVSIQVMKPEDVPSYRWDPFDVTKVWPHSDYPLTEVGRLVLNRNPQNYFAETEQAAFSPSNMVPGIEPTPDRMLQGRLFAYRDAHHYRLGTNYTQIPINAPFNAKVSNYQRDGAMTVNGNSGSEPNYGPNSVNGPLQVLTGSDSDVASAHTSNSAYSGVIKKPCPFGSDRPEAQLAPARYLQPVKDADYSQAGDLYRLQSPEEKTDLINNIVSHLKGAKNDIQDRMVANFKRADAEYGRRVEEGLIKSRSSL